MKLEMQKSPLAGLLPEGPVQTLAKLQTNVAHAHDYLRQPSSFGEESLDAISPAAQQEALNRSAEVMSFLGRLLKDCGANEGIDR